MSRARGLIILALAVWLAGTLLVRATEPEGTPKPHSAVGVPIEVVREDGTKWKATFALPALRVHTPAFAAEIDPKRIKSVALDRADGAVNVSVTLEDETHLTGTLAGDAIPVVVDGKPETVRAGADARQLNFMHPKNTTLLAAILGLITLAVMEIVLGVDNIIVLSILSAKLPEPQQRPARRIGLIAALITRLLLLFTLTWMLGLTRPVFTLPELPLLDHPEARDISWRDIILLGGGVFLIHKSVKEMHEKVESARETGHGKPGQPKARQTASFWTVIAQIAFIDILFSLDSVVTAVGMVDELWVMVGGMLIAVGVMLVAAEPVSRFVERHPTVKVLALSFLILIGALLVAEGLGQHLNKGYIYFAMAFGVAVEFINLRMRRTPPPESP